MKSELEFEKNYYREHMDFKDWSRYYEVFTELIKHNSQWILEIGSGSGVLTDLLKPNVAGFCLLDFNPKLHPDICGDVRGFYPSLSNKFDAIIALEILEHIELKEVKGVVNNFYKYLKFDGCVFVTVPHRNPFISFISVFNTWNQKTIVIPRIRNLGNKKPNDIYHKWEIGYGAKTKDLINIFESCGYKIIKYKQIPYHDYFILGK